MFGNLLAAVKAPLQSLATNVILGAVAGAAGIAGFLFLVNAAFIWLWSLYGPLVASLALAAFFLLIALVAVTAMLMAQRRNRQRAALRAQAMKAQFDPATFAVGAELLRAVRGRKATPYVLAGSLIVGWLLGRMMTGGDKSES